MAAVDHVVGTGVADPDRLGVGGWSYGGILTDYVITQDDALQGRGLRRQHRQLPRRLRDRPLPVRVRGGAGAALEGARPLARPVVALLRRREGDDPDPLPVRRPRHERAAPELGAALPGAAPGRAAWTTELVVYPDQWHSHRDAELPEGPLGAVPRVVRPLPAAGRRRRTTASRRRRRSSASRSSPPRCPRRRARSSRRTWRRPPPTSRRAPDSADAAIGLGRRHASLGQFREAIDVYTRALAKHPKDARLYRHRGHRYITVRELDKAVADLTRAAAARRGPPRRARARLRPLAPALDDAAVLGLLPPRPGALPEGRLRGRGEGLPPLPGEGARQRRPPGLGDGLALHDAAAAGARRGGGAPPRADPRRARRHAGPLVPEPPAAVQGRLRAGGPAAGRAATR